jgi:hypothetical protein
MWDLNNGREPSTLRRCASLFIPLGFVRSIHYFDTARKPNVVLSFCGEAIMCTWRPTLLLASVIVVTCLHPSFSIGNDRFGFLTPFSGLAEKKPHALDPPTPFTVCHSRDVAV